MKLKSKTVIPIAAGVLALAGSAIGGIIASGGGPPDGAPAQFAPSRGAVPVLPGNAQGVLATIAQGLPLVSNPSLATEVLPDESGLPSGSPLPVLQYELRVDSFDPPNTLKAIWEGQVFTGAVLDEFASRGFAQIASAQPTLVTPDGSRRQIGGGFGKVVNDQLFDPVPIPTSLSERVSAAEVLLGLRDVRFETLRGLQGIIAITATAATPKESVPSLVNGSPVQLLLGSGRANFEGTYLEVDGPDGQPVFVSATAPRAGAGIRWVAPSMGISISR